MQNHEIAYSEVTQVMYVEFTYLHVKFTVYLSFNH